MRKLIRNVLVLGAMSFTLFGCNQSKNDDISYNEFKTIAEEDLQKECNYTSVTINGKMTVVLGETEVKDRTLKMTGRNIDTSSFDKTDLNAYVVNEMIATVINDGASIKIFTSADYSSQGLKYYKEPLKVDSGESEITDNSNRSVVGLMTFDDYALPTKLDATIKTSGTTMKMNITLSYK